MYYRNAIVKFIQVEPKEGLQVCWKNDDGKWEVSTIDEVGARYLEDNIIWVKADYSRGGIKCISLSLLRTLVMSYSNCCGRCDGVNDECDAKNVETPLHPELWERVFSMDDFQGTYFNIIKKFDDEYASIVFKRPRTYTKGDMENAFKAGEMHCATEGKVYGQYPNFDNWIKDYE